MIGKEWCVYRVRRLRNLLPLYIAIYTLHYAVIYALDNLLPHVPAAVLPEPPTGGCDPHVQKYPEREFLVAWCTTGCKPSTHVTKSFLLRGVPLVGHRQLMFSSPATITNRLYATLFSNRGIWHEGPGVGHRCLTPLP